MTQNIIENARPNRRFHWFFSALDSFAANWQLLVRYRVFASKRRRFVASAFDAFFEELGLGLHRMKTFLQRLFTWWNSQTFGTQLWTWLYGELVGHDELGNRYYRTKNGKIDPALGINRRWVIYKGIAEASLVPPSWHGWLHHIVDTPPTQEQVKSYRWEKPHEPNLTGTPAAHRPSGSMLAEGRRPKATGDYKAWNPGDQ